MKASDLEHLDRDALIALILKQAAIIEELRAEIEGLKRSGRRQAAGGSVLEGDACQGPQEARSQAGPVAVQNARGPRR